MRSTHSIVLSMFKMSGRCYDIFKVSLLPRIEGIHRLYSKKTFISTVAIVSLVGFYDFLDRSLSSAFMPNPSPLQISLACRSLFGQSSYLLRAKSLLTSPRCRRRSSPSSSLAAIPPPSEAFGPSRRGGSGRRWTSPLKMYQSCSSHRPRQQK